MFKRAKIVMEFEVDLDMLPGWGHTTGDWVDLINRNFLLQTHYNAESRVVSADVGPSKRAVALATQVQS
ncbi:hypothetical protein [Mesorhizobium sp. NZP2298]|uniref:hypothetical protein n=1 Tax=Mesorhizobium sp. NZP2298 TaxID=2483403 RepID=UPI0015532B45|nr:hypothetical protein [Mesorhizobium sp. NZP2298]QKC99218.1 hypothetical protein EB231_35110 [Mesorhizobium sp. NZP2298]